MKRKTIRNHKDFLTPPDGITSVNSFVVVKIKPAKILGDARYGLIVSKKMFKLATARNRVKRLLRDWIAFNEDLMLPDFDYIFIARIGILNCSREYGRDRMKKAFRRIKRFVKISKKNAEQK